MGLRWLLSTARPGDGPRSRLSRLAWAQGLLPVHPRPKVRYLLSIYCRAWCSKGNKRLSFVQRRDRRIHRHL